VTERPPITRVSPALVWTGDALTLALLLLAGSVAISGGFRVWVGGWRVSVTSPERVLLAALLLTSLRHWFVRRPALPERLVEAARHAHGSEAVRAVWPVAIGSRAAVAVVGLLAVFLVGYPQGAPPFRVSKNELINLPARWDAGWYLTIAQVGYRWDRRSRGQQNIAFFPAYPMLIRVGGRLLGGSTGQVVLAGVLISYAAFFGGLLYLFKLARGHPALASSDRARAAVLLLGSYPFAVFYGTLYTEGLFLCATVGAFWHMRQQQLWRVAAWGLVAGLTRPNGLFLCLPLALMALTDAWRVEADTASRIRRAVRALLAAAAPGLGVLVYSLFLYQLTGNPFEWAAIQVRWGRTSGVAWQSLGGPFGYVAQHGFHEYLRAETPNFLNLTAAAFAAVLIWPVTRRLGVAYGALVAINLGLPLALGGAISMGRFTATMFPLFLWLGAAIPERRLGMWVLVFALGQGLMAVLFYTWRAPY
jgi:hypothetical protein